jgi:hypothetical protein
MTRRGSVEFLGKLLAALVASRCASEVLNTYVSPNANYFWAGGALAAICLLAAPSLLHLAQGEGNLLREYWPVWAYFAVLTIRLQFSASYSAKCLFSEVIAWSCFVLAVETCTRAEDVAARLRRLVIAMVKCMVVLGVGQLLLYVAASGDLHPVHVLQARPVRGFFMHPNLFQVTILPFLFYFLKQRCWTWFALTAAACFGTGSRAPFFAAACLAIPVWQSLRRQPIGWGHLAATAALVVAAYAALIPWNAPPPDYDQESRLDLGTLQWRSSFWRELAARNSGLQWLVGRGVGTADGVFNELHDLPLLPHNDYLRLFYDLGAVGLLVYLSLLAFGLRLIMRATTTENDFVLLAYLLIVCFCITDNFIYFTMPMLVYVFIGSYSGRPAAAGAAAGRAARALGRTPSSCPSLAGGEA